MSQPTKFTPETRTAIIDAIKSYATYASAAGKARIHERCLYQWIERADTELSNRNTITDYVCKDQDYVDFLHDLRDAEAQNQIKVTKEIINREGSTSGPQFFLERHPRYRKDFGRNADDMEQMRTELNEIKALVAKVLEGSTNG